MLNEGVQIRWCIRRDLPDVLAIEKSIGGPFAWSDEDYLMWLRQRSCIGLAVELRHQIVGAMVYELFPDRLELKRMVVHKECRRIGVATAMLQRLVAKLGQSRRTQIGCNVPESLVPFLLTLRENRFISEELMRHEFDEDDGIRMVYTLPHDDRWSPPFSMCDEASI